MRDTDYRMNFNQNDKLECETKGIIELRFKSYKTTYSITFIISKL